MRALEITGFGEPCGARLNPHVDRAYANTSRWVRDQGLLTSDVDLSGPRRVSTAGTSGSPSRPERVPDPVRRTSGQQAPETVASTAGATVSGVPASGIRDQVLLAAWTHPDVPGPELALIACFGVWVDAMRHHLRRHCQGTTAERYVATLRANLAGPPGGSDPRDAADPVERGLCDLRARVAPSWRWQLDTALIDLLRGHAAESAGSVVSRVPNPIDHLELGRGPGPGPWAARLVAYGLRTNLPAEVTGGAEFNAMHNAFCDLVLLRTPPDPTPESSRSVLSDSVVVLQRHFGQSRSLAMSMLTDLLSRRSQRFDELTSAALPALLAGCRDAAQRDAVLRYVQGLRDWLAGLLAWRPGTAPEGAAVTRPSAKRQRTPNRLRLPDFFMPFDTHPNPRLESVRPRTRSWAREHGLLRTDDSDRGMRQWTPAGFDDADYALLAALTAPEAGEAELALITDWQVWSWYADDHLIAARDGGAEFLDRLPMLLRPDSEATDAPWERALHDVWQRTTTSLQARPRREIAVRLAEMFELRAAELRATATADPLELLASRRRSCGGELSAALIRHLHAPGMPAELFATAAMRTLAKTFAEVSALHHDLFRFRAGPSGARPAPDVVTAVAAFLGCAPHQAVSIADDMCTARLRRFETIAHREIPSVGAEFELTPAALDRLGRYVRGMQQWMAGELRWISVTGRYAGTGDRPRRARRALGRPGPPQRRFLRRAPG